MVQDCVDFPHLHHRHQLRRVADATVPGLHLHKAIFQRLGDSGDILAVLRSLRSGDLPGVRWQTRDCQVSPGSGEEFETALSKLGISESRAT